MLLLNEHMDKELRNGLFLQSAGPPSQDTHAVVEIWPQAMKGTPSTWLTVPKLFSQYSTTTSAGQEEDFMQDCSEQDK